MGPLKSSISALTVTCLTEGDVSATRFVTPLGKQAGDGEVVLGIATTSQTSGQALAVGVVGVFDMTAGAAIARGAQVQSNAEGLPIPQADGEGVGLALSAAANPGDIVKILLK